MFWLNNKCYEFTECELNDVKFVEKTCGYKSFKEQHGLQKWVLYDPSLFYLDNDHLVWLGKTKDFCGISGASSYFRMFEKFSSIPEHLSFNGIVDTSYAFAEQSSVEHLELDGMNEVVDASFMFCGCYLYNVCLEGFNQLKTATGLFKDCKYLRSAEINFGKSYNLQSLDSLVDSCTSLKSLKISGYVNKSPSIKNWLNACNCKIIKTDFYVGVNS